MGFKILLALSAAIAVVLLAWRLRGVMLMPLYLGEHEKLTLVLTVSGPAPTLERTVDGLMWLRQNGTIRGQIMVRDAGMDEETRRAAEILERRGAIRLIS